MAISLPVEGKVGPQVLQDGALADLRLGRDGAFVSLAGHAPYQEAVLRGNVYTACANAGVTLQAGLNTSARGIVLYNPKGNQKNAAVIYAGGTVSVAFAAISTVYLAVCRDVAAAAPTGTAAVVRNALLGNAGVPSCVTLTTATLPAAPTAYVYILASGLTGGVTTRPVIPMFGSFFDGAIIVTPGTTLTFAAIAASGASGFFSEIVWEEIPV